MNESDLSREIRKITESIEVYLFMESLCVIGGEDEGRFGDIGFGILLSAREVWIAEELGAESIRMLSPRSFLLSTVGQFQHS